MEQLPLVLLAAALVVAIAGWRARGAALHAVALVLLLLVAGAAWFAAVDGGLEAGEDGRRALVVSLAMVLAALGGGPVTSSVFALVDGGGSEVREGSVRRAGDVLRGGAWIGVLERAAVFGSVAVGWPEGAAVTLALKGLGRYPELRTETPGAAERFIIGTFTSVLWAAACAGVVRLLA